MNRHLPVILLLAATASFVSCYGPTPPVAGGHGRSLDIPPRYGAPPSQTQYIDPVDPNAAATVQSPDPLAPVLGDNVTPPVGTSTSLPPPVTVTPPQVTPPAPVAPVAPAEIPVATRIPGKLGFVKSPFDTNGQPIDVRDFQSGQKAKCPYTGKVFRVP